MTVTPRSRPATFLRASLLALVAAACGQGDETAPPPPELTARGEPASAPLVDLLAGGDAVFGIFSGERTPEQGEMMGQNRELDFVFYSLEQGPFDLPTMEAYMEGIARGAADGDPHPLALRIPPVGDDPEAAIRRVGEALASGVSAIVFPHVRSRADAEVAVSSMGGALWPGNPSGTLVNMLIVEDREAVDVVDEIVSTPGVSVVFAGPGDLRRAYEGDMEAVEGAIQRVLEACTEHGVPCGITAGVEDIAERLEQGFRVIIVTAAEAVSVGRAAAGRD